MGSILAKGLQIWNKNKKNNQNREYKLWKNDTDEDETWE
jgi:hypothetical protein